jgi:glucosamine--fructose-6-phosphate aminotransferase (isomerizing)
LAELSSDLREQFTSVVEQVRGALKPSRAAPIDTVYLVGAGDSHHASRAARLAFESLGDVNCVATSCEQVIDYSVRHLLRDPQRMLLVATSASGGTEAAVWAVQRARDSGAGTLAITGKPNSALVAAAEHSLVIDLRRNERSPGLRTYQASLLGLLLTAIQLGELGNRLPGPTADELRRELFGSADAIDATNERLEGPSDEIAEMVADAPPPIMVASGPSYGAACFGAAKWIEATGRLALGRSLEAWWHVERFAGPADAPLFVLAVPERAHPAARLAQAARQLGRRVIAISHEADAEVVPHAVARLPVCGQLREEFSPLLYHLFAGHVAFRAALRLGRSLLQENPPDSVKPIQSVDTHSAANAEE